MGKRIAVFAFSVFAAVLLSAPIAWAHDGPEERPAEFSDGHAERAAEMLEWFMDAAGPVSETLARKPPDVQVSELLSRIENLPDFDVSEMPQALADQGYGWSFSAQSTWLEEVSWLLAAWDAHRRGSRELSVIEAEIRSLPTVPLDEEGRLLREQLILERDRAFISDGARHAAETHDARFSRLFPRIGRN